MYHSLEDRLYSTKPMYSMSAPVMSLPEVMYHTPTQMYKMPTYEKTVEPTKEYHHDTFLKPLRAYTQFIGNSSQIEDHVRSTFETVMNRSFPEDIVVSVCDLHAFEEMQLKTSGSINPGVLGFSINGRTKEVVICEAELDRVLMVCGHEIGHVLTPTLRDQVQEEAKAFSFEFAWARAIFDNDIAGLRGNISFDFKPARNGLHDVAFELVTSQIKKGMNPLAVFYDLIN